MVFNFGAKSTILRWRSLCHSLRSSNYIRSFTVTGDREKIKIVVKNMIIQKLFQGSSLQQRSLIEEDRLVLKDQRS